MNLTLMRLLNSVMYAPEGNGNSTGVTEPTGSKKVDTLSLVDDLDFKESETEEINLNINKDKNKGKNEEDEIKVEDDEDSSKEDDDEEVDELQELEDELKEPDEKDLELGVPSTRRQILKDYPDIFKKHPSLEKSFYRDQKFTETFEHPKDAIEAKELLDTYGKFEADLMKGDLSNVIKSVKDTDPEAFNEIVDNFIPMLEKTDRTAYLHVVENISKQVFAHVFSQNKGNDDVQEAVRIVHKAFLGKDEYEPPTKLGKGRSVNSEKSEKEIELERREKEFNERTVGAAKSTVEGDIDRVLRATIDKHIDPNESMHDYVRKNAVRDAIETYQTQVKNDSSFQKLLDRFWDAAKKSNYSKESLERITAAHKNKMSSLLGVIIRKTKNEAMKSNSSRRSNKDDDATSENQERRTRVVARPRNENGPSETDKGNKKGGRVIPRGMTTAEWLGQK